MGRQRDSWPPPGGGVPEITVQQLRDKQQAGARLFLLDVRQPWEHAQAKLEGSVLEPLNTLAQHVARIQVPEGAEVVVYCHHGMRSQMGAAILLQNGFTDAVSLAGGIDAWSAFIDPSVPRY